MEGDGPGFRTLVRAPLSLQVAQQLRERIVSGGLAVGDPLPTEASLAEQFGVSRPTVREALRILQSAGLVNGGDSISTARPRVSADGTLGSAARAFENLMLLGHVTLPDLVNLRVLIEGEAVRAAAHSSSDLLGLARSSLSDMEESVPDIEKFLAADVTFHVSLVSASGNQAYYLVLSVLRDVVAKHLRETLERQEDPRHAMKRASREHALILQAVERGDGDEARLQLRRHVLGFYTDFADEPLIDALGP